LSKDRPKGARVRRNSGKGKQQQMRKVRNKRKDQQQKGGGGKYRGKASGSLCGGKLPHSSLQRRGCSHSWAGGEGTDRGRGFQKVTKTRSEFAEGWSDIGLNDFPGGGPEGKPLYKKVETGKTGMNRPHNNLRQKKNTTGTGENRRKNKEDSKRERALGGQTAGDKRRWRPGGGRERIRRHRGKSGWRNTSERKQNWVGRENALSGGEVLKRAAKKKEREGKRGGRSDKESPPPTYMRVGYHRHQAPTF